MLKLIYCNQFKKQTISFNHGLNIVAGDSNGSNSIGKSSLLLAIDFVYGGSSYYESEDIIKNVGHHSISFVFEFKGCEYYFRRYTDHPNTVELCDSKFIKQKEIDIEEFKDFLFTKYAITLPYLKWRDMVSLYFRIYNKNNYSEIAPLHMFPKEASDAQVPRLLKLFDAYKTLAEQNEVVKETDTVYKTYVKAQQLHFIDQSITSERRMKKASENLEKLRSEAHMQQTTLITDSVSVSSEQMSLVYKLRYELSRIQLSHRKVANKIKELSANYDQVEANFQIDKDVLDYFPGINLKKIEEINSFHKSLSRILKHELAKQIKELESRERNLQEQENHLLEGIGEALNENNNAKEMALKNYMAMHQEIEDLVKGINAFKSSVKYKFDRDNAVLTYNNLFSEIKGGVAVLINKELELLNDYIYDGQKKAPYLDIISPKKYNLVSPDDTGAGSRYRSLIIFDIAVLKLTQLPALCHDTILYKNIESTAITRILSLYKSIPDKQIFISIDEIEKLSKDIQESIKESIVIELMPNGNELYGWSWNTK